MTLSALLTLLTPLGTYIVGAIADRWGLHEAVAPKSVPTPTADPVDTLVAKLQADYQAALEALNTAKAALAKLGVAAEAVKTPPSPAAK